MVETSSSGLYSAGNVTWAAHVDSVRAGDFVGSNQRLLAESVLERLSRCRWRGLNWVPESDRKGSEPMVTRLEKIAFEHGGHVLIEAYELDSDLQRIALGDQAARTFEAAWDDVQPVIRSLAGRMADLGPTEAQVKFGVKIGTNLNAIIAGANGEANFEISLTWKPER
jgi:hypothetical protein